MPTVNFAHLADSAFTSSTGKLSVINIFTSIFSQSFPVVHPKMTVVLNITFVETESKAITVRMLDSSGQQMLSQDVDMQSAAVVANTCGAILDFVVTTFQQQGNYRIVVIHNSIEIHSIPFDVSLQ